MKSRLLKNVSQVQEVGEKAVGNTEDRGRNGRWGWRKYWADVTGEK